MVNMIQILILVVVILVVSLTLHTKWRLGTMKDTSKWWVVVISVLLFQDQAPQASVGNEG